MKITKNYLIENKLIRKGSEIIISELQEAFKSGTASNVVQKLGNILGRKIGISFQFSDIPLEYQNGYGQFAGFYGFASNGLIIKINFKLSGSDSIESFDVYLNGLDSEPDYTVDVSGLNIVQIVDVITENLVEDGEASESALMESTITEKGVPTDPSEVATIIQRWVDEESLIKDVQNKAVPELFSEAWGNWVKDKPNYLGIKYYLFAKGLKQFLLSKGLTNKTFRPRKKGTKEREIIDPVLADQFEQIIESMSWQEKFDILKNSVQAIIDGDIQALYVAGEPGSGKSFIVEEYLNNSNADFRIYKGGVKGMDELIILLWKHREDRILVFDDFDSILKQKDSANIFKAILENKPVRKVTYVDLSRGKNKNLAEIPQIFEFTSKVIFISNQRKIDSAIASRALLVEVNLSNEEVLDKIDKTLQEYRPDLPMSMKKDALNYLQEISTGVKTIDYRSMDKVLVAMKISPSNWKKTALMFIKSLE